MKIDLSIIIVSYNTADLLIAAIDSIIQTAKKVKYEIIVVDNASADTSVLEVKKLQKQNSSIILIDNKQNSGFSKANNQGVARSSGRYVLFLNSDTVVYENTLDGMVDFMDQHERVGAATCYLEMPNGRLDDATHRGFPTPLRAFSHFSGLSKLFPHSRAFAGYTLGWMDLKRTHEIEALAGAFMIVRRVAGEEVGWWDEDFFWYGEDLDFCYRLKEKKWQIYFVPEYKILHYKGASGGIKKESQGLTKATLETKKKATDARFNAMRIFYNKHYKNKYPAIVTWFVLKGIDIKHTITKNSV
jgi:GT2 family glycosyltransferase